MWIKEPGKLTDKLIYLGTSEVGIYLLQGKEGMLIGGGMSWIVPALEKQLSTTELDSERIKYLVISHSHFDHCGAVPYLKQRFPRAEIIASEYSARVFSNQKAVSFISAMNRAMIRKLGIEEQYGRRNLEFDRIKVDHVVKEGDVIDLGEGVEVHFMEVPGHTRCSIAVYVPKLRILFPGDAIVSPLGVGEAFLPGMLHDYHLYIESYRRLADLPVEICAFEHGGVVIGTQVKEIFNQGFRKVEEFRNYVVQVYKQTGDLEETVQRVSEGIQREVFTFLTEELLKAVFKTAIQKVLRSVGINSGSYKG